MPVNSAPDSIVHSVSTYHYSNVLLGIKDDTKANKIFIPFEATNALSGLGAAAEMFKEDNKKAEK